MRKRIPIVIIITAKPTGLLCMLHNSGEGTETDIVNGLPYIRLDRGQEEVTSAMVGSTPFGLMFTSSKSLHETTNPNANVNIMIKLFFNLCMTLFRLKSKT